MQEMQKFLERTPPISPTTLAARKERTAMEMQRYANLSSEVFRSTGHVQQRQRPPELSDMFKGIDERREMRKKVGPKYQRLPAYLQELVHKIQFRPEDDLPKPTELLNAKEKVANVVNSHAERAVERACLHEDVRSWLVTGTEESRVLAAMGNSRLEEIDVDALDEAVGTTNTETSVNDLQHSLHHLSSFSSEFHERLARAPRIDPHLDAHAQSFKTVPTATAGTTTDVVVCRPGINLPVGLRMLPEALFEPQLSSGPTQNIVEMLQDIVAKKSEMLVGSLKRREAYVINSVARIASLKDQLAASRRELKETRDGIQTILEARGVSIPWALHDESTVVDFMRDNIDLILNELRADLKKEHAHYQHQAQVVQQREKRDRVSHRHSIREATEETVARLRRQLDHISLQLSAAEAGIADRNAEVMNLKVQLSLSKAEYESQRAQLHEANAKTRYLEEAKGMREEKIEILEGKMAALACTSWDSPENNAKVKNYVESVTQLLKEQNESLQSRLDESQERARKAESLAQQLQQRIDYLEEKSYVEGHGSQSPDVTSSHGIDVARNIAMEFVGLCGWITTCAKQMRMALRSEVGPALRDRVFSLSGQLFTQTLKSISAVESDIGNKDSGIVRHQVKQLQNEVREAQKQTEYRDDPTEGMLVTLQSSLEGTTEQLKRTKSESQAMAQALRDELSSREADFNAALSLFDVLLQEIATISRVRSVGIIDSMQFEMPAVVANSKSVQLHESWDRCKQVWLTVKQRLQSESAASDGKFASQLKQKLDGVMHCNDVLLYRKATQLVRSLFDGVSRSLLAPVELIVDTLRPDPQWRLSVRQLDEIMSKQRATLLAVVRNMLKGIKDEIAERKEQGRLETRITLLSDQYVSMCTYLQCKMERMSAQERNAMKLNARLRDLKELRGRVVKTIENKIEVLRQRRTHRVERMWDDFATSQEDRISRLQSSRTLLTGIIEGMLNDVQVSSTTLRNLKDEIHTLKDENVQLNAQKRVIEVELDDAKAAGVTKAKEKLKVQVPLSSSLQSPRSATEGPKLASRSASMTSELAFSQPPSPESKAPCELSVTTEAKVSAETLQLSKAKAPSNSSADSTPKKSAPPPQGAALPAIAVSQKSFEETETRLRAAESEREAMRVTAQDIVATLAGAFGLAPIEFGPDAATALRDGIMLVTEKLRSAPPRVQTSDASTNTVAQPSAQQHMLPLRRQMPQPEPPNPQPQPHQKAQPSRERGATEAPRTPAAESRHKDAATQQFFSVASKSCQTEANVATPMKRVGSASPIRPKPQAEAESSRNAGAAVEVRSLGGSVQVDKNVSVKEPSAEYVAPRLCSSTATQTDRPRRHPSAAESTQTLTPPPPSRGPVLSANAPKPQASQTETDLLIDLLATLALEMQAATATQCRISLGSKAMPVPSCEPSPVKLAMAKRSTLGRAVDQYKMSVHASVANRARMVARSTVIERRPASGGFSSVSAITLPLSVVPEGSLARRFADGERTQLYRPSRHKNDTVVDSSDTGKQEKSSVSPRRSPSPA